MTRFNTNTTHYGATSSAAPPPPYSGIATPSGPSGWSPTNVGLAKPSLLSEFLGTRSFVALVTFFITLGLCVSTIPFKYCDDPIDPQVRERIRGEWSKEVLEHEKQVIDREIVWVRWAWEDQQHAALLHEWEHERVQHERELKERARREEEERKQLDLFWGHVETHQCKTYGTREYTAVLMNLPADLEWRVQACKATPLEVHGVSRFPKSCEDMGRGLVVGSWEIDQYEPDCNTFWNWYKDKERLHLEWIRKEGKPYLFDPNAFERPWHQRIEHYLENLPKGGDWREFCATTPARFHEMEFSGAQECFQYNLGTYGHWEINDSNC